MDTLFFASYIIILPTDCTVNESFMRISKANVVENEHDFVAFSRKLSTLLRWQRETEGRGLKREIRQEK